MPKDRSLKSILNDEFVILDIYYFTLLLFQEGLRTNLNAYNSHLI